MTTIIALALYAIGLMPIIDGSRIAGNITHRQAWIIALAWPVAVPMAFVWSRWPVVEDAWRKFKP